MANCTCPTGSCNFAIILNISFNYSIIELERVLFYVEIASFFENLLFSWIFCSLLFVINGTIQFLEGVKRKTDCTIFVLFYFRHKKSTDIQVKPKVFL